MGICPTSLSPQQREINRQNKQLLALLRFKIQDLQAYSFAREIQQGLSSMQNRYLYSQGIVEDIYQLVRLVDDNRSIKSQSSMGLQALQEQIRNSCLIIQDQLYNNNPKPTQPQTQNQIIHSLPESTQYKKNLADNQSLVCQIKILYQQDLDLAQYHNSLKLFLKWNCIFYQHFCAGFLKPIYRLFCVALYKEKDLDVVVQEVTGFVGFMVGVVTDVYRLKQLAAGDHGSLFKNQNVYNIIMAGLFKRTKIRRFVRKIILEKDAENIVKYRLKLHSLKNKDMDFFGVQQKFQLLPESHHSSININQSTQFPLIPPLSPPCPPCPQYPHTPYNSIIPLIHKLCESSQTPITKLKLIVQISKQITSTIYKHYDNLHKQVPEIDPDNMTSIIMYLIVQAARQDLYEELRIAQLFTTGNCLTCISGFYLNMFRAAVELLTGL